MEVNLLHASRFGARVRAILLGWGGLEIAALGAAAFAQGFLVVNVLAVAFTNFAFFHELIPRAVTRCATLFDFWLAVVFTFFAVVPRISRHFKSSH